MNNEVLEFLKVSFFLDGATIRIFGQRGAPAVPCYVSRYAPIEITEHSATALMSRPFSSLWTV